MFVQDDVASDFQDVILSDSEESQTKQYEYNNRSTNHSDRSILPVKQLCSYQQNQEMELGKLLAHTGRIRMACVSFAWRLVGSSSWT